MWRDKIIQAKRSGRSEKTVKRIFNGETMFPPIDTIIEIGAALGFSENELFSESNLVVSNDDLVRLQTELAQLMDKCVRLEVENDHLRTKLSHTEQLLAHKEEIIALHKALQKREGI